MKNKSIAYQCQHCGYISKKWLGKCPDCGAWNSFVEDFTVINKKEIKNIENVKAVPISNIKLEQQKRISSKFIEFDKVIGGGFISGQVILLGGSPGIGKSTLITQILDNVSDSHNLSVYLSAEESLNQIKIRTNRLNISNDNIYIVNSNEINSALTKIENLNPKFLVIDSIQTIYSDNISSIPGSISQIKECCNLLIEFAKSKGIVLIIIGHITKEGSIAGPKILEHMVDTVLYFESETSTTYRIIRSLKNRFGNINEIAIFEMSAEGLHELKDPSNIFIENRSSENIGSIIFPLVEGTRIFLIEIQALVASTSYSMPRRSAQGIDPNRLNLLITIAEKHLGLQLYSNDVFINVPGGIRLNDPAVDLAVIFSILSSFLNKKIDTNWACFGEVGLNGEIRKSSFYNQRINEALKLGFKKIFTPKQKFNGEYSEKIQVVQLSNIINLIDILN